jgi:hypothetical protein
MIVSLYSSESAMSFKFPLRSWNVGAVFAERASSGVSRLSNTGLFSLSAFLLALQSSGPSEGQ